jgi:ParB-like chromosome segregation protein Spo0J
MKHQVMPPLSEEEYESLKSDIAEHGVRVPVVVDEEGVTIDGHHRIRAWEELREDGREVPDYPKEVRSDLKTDAEKNELALKLNMQRRHLNRAQKRDIIAAKLGQSPEWSNNRIGSLLGVDSVTVSSVRLRLEVASEIPKLKNLVGADGKEYPRHYASEIEDQVSLLQEQNKKKIRNVLLSPTTSRRSDTGIAEDLNVSVEEVAEQRKALEEDGPTLGEMAQRNPEVAQGIAEAHREFSEGSKRRHARYRISGFVLDAGIQKVAPEDVASDVLAEEASDRAEIAVRGKRPGMGGRLDRELEYARELRDWRDRYIKALEEGGKPTIRVVK